MMNKFLKVSGGVILFNLTAFGSMSQAIANTVTATSDNMFAVVAENRVILNNGGDFEGDTSNPADDALIYAANGFNMNNLANTFLATQRDSNGILFENGQKLLVENAIAVSSAAPSINASNSPYVGLAQGTAPFTVAPYTVDLPSYQALLASEKASHNASSSAVDFNASSNPINNVSDWNNNFPQPGTAGSPTVVNVTSGLTIPDGVNLENYILTVDGSVNFNGTSKLSNVVLIVNGGGINLGNTQIHNSAVFAPGAINMNNTARFSGSSLLASEADVNFNGGTATVDATDELRVISQNTIHYNAAINSRGRFLAGGNVMFNGATSLYGSIGAMDSVTCNSSCSVVAVHNNGGAVAPEIEPNIFAD